MTKKFLIGGGVLTVAAVAAVVAVAAPGQMGKADTNSDGMLSKAEVTAMASAHFRHMDANNDGQIDAADREAFQKARFGEIDADKNGSITEAEFSAAHANRREMRAEQRGQRMGVCGGHHGRGHHGGGMMMLKMADANNDQTITRAEMMAAVDAHFAKADTNKDGQISRAEGAAFKKAIRGRMKASAPAT